jgi:hypothetical protein
MLLRQQLNYFWIISDNNNLQYQPTQLYCQYT